MLLLVQLLSLYNNFISQLSSFALPSNAAPCPTLVSCMQCYCSIQRAGTGHYTLCCSRSDWRCCGGSCHSDDCAGMQIDACKVLITLNVMNMQHHIFHFRISPNKILTANNTHLLPSKMLRASVRAYCIGLIFLLLNCTSSFRITFY